MAQSRTAEMRSTTGTTPGATGSALGRTADVAATQGKGIKPNQRPQDSHTVQSLVGRGEENRAIVNQHIKTTNTPHPKSRTLSHVEGFRLCGH
jgi:hypothetical protein